MTLSTLLFSAKGRISRKTYWLTTLGLIVAYIVLEIPVGVFAPSKGSDETLGPLGIAAIVVAFIGIIVFAYASIVIAIKRWHDRDKSGWWVLIGFIPLIGGIWALIENGFLRGTVGANRFGMDPLGGYSEQIGQVFETPTQRL